MEQIVEAAPPAPPPRTLAQRIFINPRDFKLRSGWAMAIFLVTSALASGAASTPFVLAGFGPMRARLDAPVHLPWGLASLGAVVLGSWLACLCVRQPMAASGFARPAVRPLGLGFLIGALFVSVVSLTPVLLGKSALSGSEATVGELLSAGALQLAVLAPASATEEVWLRGFLLQQLVRGINRPVAVCLTGVLFGLGHLGNPMPAASPQSTSRWLAFGSRSWFCAPARCG